MVKQFNLSLNDFTISDTEIRQAFSNITKNNPIYNDLTSSRKSPASKPLRRKRGLDLLVSVGV